jgi:DNA-directed RNA polymerase subunit M/transcription elongation factor TFIIS
MTPSERRLKDQAAEIAQHYISYAVQLRQERERLQAQISDIEAKLAAAYHTNQRLASFQPRAGGNYSCPRCWMDNEVLSFLRLAGASTQHEDFWTCATCGSEFSIPK